MSPRRVVVAALAVGAATAGVARADTPGVVAPSPAVSAAGGVAARSVPPRREPYAGWVVATNALSIAAVWASSRIDDPMSTQLLSIGGLGVVFAAPATHVAHGRTSTGLRSLASHLLLPLVGVLAGGATAGIATGDESDGEYLLAGLAGGWLVSAAIDVAMAR